MPTGVPRRGGEERMSRVRLANFLSAQFPRGFYPHTFAMDFFDGSGAFLIPSQFSPIDKFFIADKRGRNDGKYIK